MKNSEIRTILNEIIENYISDRYERSEAVDRLIKGINPVIIYNLVSDPLITDCYFAIKHLTEKEFETTKTELAYLRDCINGKREYNLDEKNRFILQENLNQK